MHRRGPSRDLIKPRRPGIFRIPDIALSPNRRRDRGCRLPGAPGQKRPHCLESFDSSRLTQNHAGVSSIRNKSIYSAFKE